MANIRARTKAARCALRRHRNATSLCRHSKYSTRCQLSQSTSRRHSVCWVIVMSATCTRTTHNIRAPPPPPLPPPAKMMMTREGAPIPLLPPATHSPLFLTSRTLFISRCLPLEIDGRWYESAKFQTDAMSRHPLKVMEARGNGKWGENKSPHSNANIYKFRI